jgi:hypothetical protein
VYDARTEIEEALAQATSCIAEHHDAPTDHERLRVYAERVEGRGG